MRPPVTTRRPLVPAVEQGRCAHGVASVPLAEVHRGDARIAAQSRRVVGGRQAKEAGIVSAEMQKAIVSYPAGRTAYFGFADGQPSCGA